MYLAIIWAKKKFSKSRIHILPNYGQTDSKTAIVVRTVHDFSTVTLPIYSQFQWMKYFKRCLSFISFLPNMNETLSAKLIMTTSASILG